MARQPRPVREIEVVKAVMKSEQAVGDLADATRARAVLAERAAARPDDQTARAELRRADAVLADTHATLARAQVEHHRMMEAVLDERRRAERIMREEQRRAAAPAASRRAAREAVQDAAGFDLRPDPLQVGTPGELVKALGTFRIWAGEPPYREIARRAGNRVAASTIHTALKTHDELPSLRVVLAVVIGCGGSEEDQRRFATAWRLLRLGRETGAQNRPELRVVSASGRS